MRNLSDPFDFSTPQNPTVQDEFGDICTPANRPWFESIVDTDDADEAHRAEQAAIEADDAFHCRECGCIAAGTMIAGTHVQICDECLLAFVRQQGILA